MTIFPKFFMDEGKRRAEDVRWALQSFNCGIKDYYEDTFRQFHDNLYNNVVHLRGICCKKCSQTKPVNDWCSLCSEWHKAILAKHVHQTFAKVNMNWRNVDSTKWPTDFREVQKVFLPSWYKGKLDSDDLSTCLSIMTNCTLFISRRKLLNIKDIRNKVSHGAYSLTETERKQYIGKILSHLKKDELKTYRSVKREINHLSILESHSLKDIYEKNLIDEIERIRIEEKLYGERNLFGCFQMNAKTCYLLTTLIVALLSIIVYVWNQENTTEGSPWIPGQSAFFFTIHDDFVGREWLKEKIRNNLNQNKNGVILVAEPGFGKSALIANFIKTYEDEENNIPLLGYHICQYDSPSSLDVSNFIIQLWRNLRKKYNILNQKIPAKFEIGNEELRKYCKLDPFLCFRELIANPMNKVDLTERSLFIVDAIDECQRPSLEMGTTSIFHLLTNHYIFLTPVVSILMTSKNDSLMLSRFRSFTKLNIEPNTSENKNDLKRYIQHKTRCTDNDVNRLVENTSQNFLILKHSLILDNNIDTCRLLNGQRIYTIFEIYDSRFLYLYGNDYLKKYRTDRYFFEVLCSKIVDGSITIGMMRNILNHSNPPPDDDYFDEMIHRMATHFIRLSKNNEIHLIHSSFIGWLTSNEKVKVHRGHELWANYLYNKLKIELTNSSLIYENSLIHQIFALALHFSYAENESLNNKLKSGRVKINDMRISCSLCWRKILPNSVINDATMSHIGYAAFIFDNYKFIKTLAKMSWTTDWTKEAFFACGNTNAFKALVESGKVDLKVKHLAIDNWMTFGNCCVPGIQRDFENDESIVFEGKTKTIQQILFDSVGNFSFDYVSIFHVLILKGDLDSVYSFASKDISLLDETTGNGWDVFDIAVAYDNLIMLKELQKFKPMKTRTWYLWYASWRGSIAIIKYLISQKIRDECYGFSGDRFDRNNALYAAFLKNSKNVSSLFSVSKKFKLRRDLMHESALMVAVKQGYHEVVSALLLHTTRCLEQEDAFGLTPLAASIYNRHESIVKILLDYNANIHFTVKSLLNYSDVEFFNMVLRLPLEKKWNNNNDLNGATIFHLSVLKPTCFSTVHLRKIMQKNPSMNLDIKDENSHSPLYYAICHPDADNTYSSFADLLQPKSHRMVFFLIAAANFKSISDSLLVDLGICGRHKQHNSSLLVKSRYKERFCKLKKKFPKLSDFNFSSIPVKHMVNISMETSYLLKNYTLFVSERWMSHDRMLVMFCREIVDSKDIKKFQKDNSEYYVHFYLRALKFERPYFSVLFQNYFALTEACVI